MIVLDADDRGADVSASWSIDTGYFSATVCLSLRELIVMTRGRSSPVASFLVLSSSRFSVCLGSVMTMICHINACFPPLLRTRTVGARVASRVRAGDGGHLRDLSVGVGAGSDCRDHKREGPSSMDLL